MHRELDAEFTAVSEQGLRTLVANIARVTAILEGSNDPNLHHALCYAQRAWIQLDQQNPASTIREERVGESRSQANSRTAGGMIIEGLKKRLYDENSKKGGKWIHELPHVVWGLRTQLSKATGQTPFFLVYGSKAILLADIMWKSPRVEMYNAGEADGARQLELDDVEEVRCTALVQSARYLQRIRQYHDRVRLTQAQLEMGRTVCRQADYKIRVLSATIPRGPRHPKFLERSEPVQVLPIRRRARIAVLRAPRRFSSDSTWRL
jgi:hypothetical protein